MPYGYLTKWRGPFKIKTRNANAEVWYYKTLKGTLEVHVKTNKTSKHITFKIPPALKPRAEL